MYLYTSLNKTSSTDIYKNNYSRSDNTTYIVVTPVSTLNYFDAIMLCARSNDVTACFFVCKQHSFTLSRKNKLKLRDYNVRNNRFCQCTAVWSSFLRLKITHHIKVKFSPS